VLFRSHVFIVLGLSAATAFSQNPTPSVQPKLQLLQQPRPADAATNAPLDPKKVGYALGWMQGSDMKRREINLDTDSLLSGLRDALENKTPQMTQTEAQDILNKWQMERQMAFRKKQQEDMEKRKLEGPKNKAAGEAFLAEKAKEPGVVKLPSGLEYKIVKEGTGATPKKGDTVSTLYRGTFINGKEFDSTANRGNQPFKFAVGNGQVIKGWDEALQLMKVGSKWTIYVPSDLAYGDNGRGQIGPNETLVFVLELVDVTPAMQPASNGNNQQVVSGEIIKVPSAEELKKGAKIEVIHPDKTNK